MSEITFKVVSWNWFEIGGLYSCRDAWPGRQLLIFTLPNALVVNIPSQRQLSQEETQITANIY